MGLVRLLLAVSVAVFHTNGGKGLLPGGLAVEMFFIISGFYMSLVLTEKYEPRTWRGVVTFYQGRFLRLWPTFALTTVIVWLWSAIVTFYVGQPPGVGGHLHQLLDNPLASAAIFLSNIVMIGQDIPANFHIDASGTVLAFVPNDAPPDGAHWLAHTLNIVPAWSIGVEIWFYLLVPFLVRAPCSALVGLMVASGTLRYFMHANGLYGGWFFPAQLCLFLAGALAHRFGARVPLHCRTTAVAALLAVAGGCIAFGPAFGLSEDFKWVLYAAFAATMHGLFRWSSASSFDRLTGEMSYPIYLTHSIVAFIAAVAAKRLFGAEIGVGIFLMLVLPLSLALVLLVERPVARFRARVAVRAERRPAAMGSA
jgi:peptidoglycan/LPS O-acetylase OafA/YrhL